MPCRTVLKIGGLVLLLGALIRLVAAPQEAWAQTPTPFLISPYFGEETISQNYSAGHPAIDFGSLDYERVLAGAGGTVDRVQWWNNSCHQESTDSHNCGFGLYVRINHDNGYRTWYAHLSATAFPLGTTNVRVSQEQVVATGGHTGFSTGPHLHFQVQRYVNGAWTNVNPFNESGTSLWIDGQWANPSRPIPAPVERGEIIVDDTSNNSGGFTKGRGGPFNTPCPPNTCPSWWSAPAGYGSDMWWTYVNPTADYWARWTPNFSQPGIYEVYVHVPNANANATTWQAKYTIQHANGESSGTVDQNGLNNQWVSIGVYRFPKGSTESVYLTDLTGEDYRVHCYDAIGSALGQNYCQVGVDAVKFVREDGASYGDASPSVAYTGSWTHSSPWSKAYANTVSWSNAVGSKTRLINFYGSRITRLYTMASNRGSETIRIDGASQGTTSSYAWETRWQAAKSWTFSPGYHTIEVEVAGGGYSDLDAFVVDLPAARSGTPYDDPHYHLNSIGAWTHGTGWSSAYGGTDSWSKTKEDAITFTFVGTQVTWVYTKTYNRGIAAIAIDGVNRGTIDLYSASTQWQQNTVFTNLGAGVHTIHISVTGVKNLSSSDYYVGVDAFIVQ